MNPHRKRIAQYLVLALVTVATVGLSATPAAAATEQVGVNVANVLQTGTAGGARLGINTDYWWDNQANRVTGARTLPAALSDMGAKYWRYPGGEKGDGYLWSTPPFTASNPRLARISSQDWPSNDPAYWNPPGDPAGAWAHAPYGFDQFMTDCRAANCIPVMVVAYDGIYKAANTGGTSLTRQQALDTAKAWVNYANNVKGYGIRYWEIGNETWNPGYMGADPGRAQQAADIVTFCQYMKQADSTILCGVNANSQADWNTLLATAAPEIGFLSVHAYESWPYTGYKSYFNGNLNQLVKVDEAWNALQAYPAHRDRIKIAVTETGGITFGVNGTWTQGDLGHALMTFDTMAQFQQDPRVTFSQFWNTRWIEQNKAGNVWPGYPSGEYDALKPDNTLAPQGLAVKILAGFSFDRMVGTASTTKVRVFASHDPATGRLNVWLINKSTSATTTKLTLNGYTPGSAAVSALTGTGPTDLYPVYLNKSPVTPIGGQLSLTLDRSSITILRF